MKHNNNIVYVDNVKIAQLVYVFIQARIDHSFTSYSCRYLTHNEQLCMSNISHLIEADLYIYLSTLISDYLPSSVIKDIGDLPLFIEHLIIKWSPVIKDEIEQRINYIAFNSHKKKEA